MNEFFMSPTSTSRSKITDKCPGSYRFREGYVKIDEGENRMPTICVVFWNTDLKRKMYIPFKDLGKDIKDKYKEMYVDLSHL